MSKLIYFSSEPSNSAAENLQAFIRKCRNELADFGAKLNWDDWSWPGIAHFTKLGVNARAAKDDNKFDDAIIDFAKAYFRFQQGNHPTVARFELLALRAVEAGLLQVKSQASIDGIDTLVLDEAVQIARQHYSPGSAYHCGRELERLAKFVSEKQLIDTDVRTWKNPIIKPVDMTIQTGLKAKKIREKRLPSNEALNAMAEIYSTRPSDPKDIFTSSLFAMSMSAPFSGTELLELPADCEVEERDKDGIIRYGWRYFSGRSNEWDIKWIQAEMVPIAKDAVNRILTLTEEARKLARCLESESTQFFRHSESPDVTDDEPLTAEQAAMAMGVKNIGYLKLSRANGAHTLNSLWQYIKGHQPKTFPWLNMNKGIKYSNALFCMTRDLLTDRYGKSLVMLWAPDINVFNNDLSHRSGINHHQSIFERSGYKSEDGQYLSLTSHQARNLLISIAGIGGMAQSEISRWAGRADLKQNCVINQISEFEMVATAEAMDTSLTLSSPKCAVSPNDPITAQELDLMEHGPQHVTEFGVCVHDWVMSPCEKFRDCLNCSEQVCIKGNVERLNRIKAQLVEVEKNYAQAKDALAKGYAGADRWFEHHKRMVAHLRKMVKILEDTDLPDGTQIKLRDGKEYSHLRRAIQARTADAQLHNSTEASLLLEMSKMLGGGLG